MPSFIRHICRWLRSLFTAILRLLYSFGVGWAIALIRLIEEQRRRRQEQTRLVDQGEAYTRCQVVPPDVYKRPDPLIYAQYYLMKLGLAVTWDNPDIALFDLGGNPVSSNELTAGTEYEIQATIYNGSPDAPAVGMTVEFSYLSFGIGTTSNPIGNDTIDLPVKGAPGHPALARTRWRTPSEPGHYCIQVKLVWADDANPDNNLGQENTDVGAARSPANFEFPLRNGNVASETLELIADMYELPEPPSCEETEGNGLAVGRSPARGRGGTGNGRPKGGSTGSDLLLERHRRGQFEIDRAWQVRIDPRAVELGAGESTTVRVAVEPPADFSGTQPINISAVDQAGYPVGGVTLYVTA